MNICFFIHTLNIGGAENIVVQYLEKLQSNGHHVFLIQNYETESFLSDKVRELNIPVYCLDRYKPENIIHKCLYRIDLIHSANRLNRIILENKIDIIHFHGHACGMKKISIPQNRVFFTFHSAFERNLTNLGSRRVKDLKDLADRGMNFLILDRSEYEMIKDYFHTDRVYVLPNGIDFDRLAAHRVKKDYLMSDYQVDKDDYIVGHVGRFHEVKNHEKVIEVFNKILEKKKNAKLVLVGGDVDGRMAMIREICKKRGIECNVVFLGNRSDVSELMSIFDLFVFPSHSECFPLSILEAQYFGIPCVISDSITEEIICNSNCIKISNTESGENWAEKALKMKQQTPDESLFRYHIRNAVSQLESYYVKALQE